MKGWNVWFGYEAKPGITKTSMQDLSQHWRALAESCRGPDGRINMATYEYWLDLIVDHAHLWGYT